MRRNTLLICLLSILATVACDDNGSPTAPPADPEPVETFTETFAGEIRLGETSCHVFTAVQAGETELQITSLEPLQTLTVGLGIGAEDGDPETACAYFASDRSVRVAETLLTTLAAAGDYCVCIFDVGNIFADETVEYVFDVEHP